MAEYYPLLSKAIGSLPNSTPESRKLVYERARKALIGQLRTLHPAVPDADIERESTALDRAIDQVEAELVGRPGPDGRPAFPPPPKPPGTAVKPAAPARGLAGDAASRLSPAPPRFAVPPLVAPTRKPVPAPPMAAPPAPEQAPVPISPAAGLPAQPSPPQPSPPQTSPAQTPSPSADTANNPAAPFKIPPRPTISTGPLGAPRLDTPPQRPSIPPAMRQEPAVAVPGPAAEPLGDTAAEGGTAPPDGPEPSITVPPQSLEPELPASEAALARSRIEPQRPFAPQPPKQRGPRRPLWIIPLGIGIVVAIVAGAAYKLRDQPDLLMHAKPAEKQNDASKIVQRVGGAGQAPAGTQGSSDTQTDSNQRAPQQDQSGQQQTNPPVAVAGRAALLVEAPDEPNKVKTYLGTVTWRLDNVSDDQNRAVGLAVRADVDIPEDKLKVSVVFQKNTDPSLPASHTMKVRFILESGGVTGSVRQINVPQMRLENSDLGEPLDGVTVPIVENSFLVGLSPGNSETANLNLINSRQWIDIPMVLTSGRIAKLTFEKTEAGQRDLHDAIAAWSKQ